jgi:hypothetical protein
VFFSSKEGIELIKKYRTGLPTHYIEYNISDFYTYKYKDKMITHRIHCPSVELNLIWNEKIILIEKASTINPFNSEFFFWVDAGICNYRNNAPPSSVFPNINKLQDLPKDRFIYSASNRWNPRAVSNSAYYHHISGTFILHKNIIRSFSDVYKLYLNKIFMDDILCKSNIWTEQVILTHLFKSYTHKFYKLCDGYGEILNYLYSY